MQLLPFLYPALLALLTFTPLSAAKPKDAILLSKVKSLTLRNNAKTSHRRVPAVPQLSCQGPGCQHYKVDIMRCVNQGSDYSSEDIQWSCSANLPEEFKLGSTEVICEGYDSKDDDYVLKGSCAVEYRLLLTSLGEEKYGKSYWDGGGGDVEKGLGLLFWVIFIGVVLWILYSMWQNYQQGPNPQGPRRNLRGGGGWGGGGAGPDDPYDPPPPYPGTGKRYTRNYGAADQAWRPGFWSGAAAGAAGGYFAGNRAANRRQNQGSSWGGGGSGWGSSSGPSSPASGSSNSRSSTGFGSTSRR